MAKSGFDFPKSMSDFPKSLTDLPKSVCDLAKSLTDLPKSAFDLPKSVTDFGKSEPDKEKSDADFGKSRPDFARLGRGKTLAQSLRLFRNFLVGLMAQQIGGEVTRVIDHPDFRKIDVADHPVFVRQRVFVIQP